MLCSHGNAESRCKTHEHLVDLAEILGVDVCAYDYGGYGFSKSKGILPSEAECFVDIETVFELLTADKGHPESGGEGDH